MKPDPGSSEAPPEWGGAGSAILLGWGPGVRGLRLSLLPSRRAPTLPPAQAAMDLVYFVHPRVEMGSGSIFYSAPGTVLVSGSWVLGAYVGATDKNEFTK